MEWATMDVFREHIYKDRWLLNHLGTGKPTNFRVRCHMHTSVAWCRPYHQFAYT